MTEMDHSHPPIKVAYQDTIVLSYLHYGESTLIVRLRQLPYIELAVGALFILIGYISFSYVKRSEQSNIWVGMARETAHQLGTPISSMLGWTELLKEQAAGDTKRLRLCSIWKTIFTVFKRSPIDFQRSVLNRICMKRILLNDQKVTEYYQRRIPQLGKKVHLSLESEEAVKAHLNRELFEWVIENLTKNALDAIENGEGTISYAIGQTDRYTYIDISDTAKVSTSNIETMFSTGILDKKTRLGTRPEFIKTNY